MTKVQRMPLRNARANVPCDIAKWVAESALVWACVEKTSNISDP